MSSESPLIRSLQSAKLQEHVPPVTKTPLLVTCIGWADALQTSLRQQMHRAISTEKPTRADALYVVHQTHPANTPGPS
jgi:hypothetical protein